MVKVMGLFIKSKSTLGFSFGGRALTEMKKWWVKAKGSHTVKPTNKGHIGTSHLSCREVVLFSEVFFETYWKVLKDK